MTQVVNKNDVLEQLKLQLGKVLQDADWHLKRFKEFELQAVAFKHAIVQLEAVSQEEINATY